MPTLQEDQYGLEMGEVVQLFQLDATSLGGSVYCFTPSVDLKKGSVFFQGIEYPPVDIVVDGFEISSRGSLPTPTVRISNVTRAVSAIINDLGDDLVGCIVTRIRTLSKYLDGAEEADPTAMYPPDVFIIEQKSGENKLLVEFQLAAAIDVAGQVLPRRQILRNYCARGYRRYQPLSGGFDYTKASCPYTGVKFFDRQNNPTDAAHDQCSKNFQGCKLRFNPDPLPAWFFPGAGRFGNK